MAEFIADCEQLAYKATQNCEAFKGINLLSIKDKLTVILNNIGANGMFDEYTKHNITHVNGVLELVDKIITEDTKKILTMADWLVIVLAVYFHDMGMFIPKKEFEERNNNIDFQNFKTEEETKFSKQLNKLPDDERERFIYQEYVRRNHGKRVRIWLTDRDSVKEYGFSKELDEMFIGLSPELLESIAIICESHNLDNLDMDQLEVDFAFGSGKQEKANLLYAAIILRTADLLHVTSDRTPTTEFNIIDVQNPISQLEWAKQKAVRSVDVKNTDENGVKLDGIKPTEFEIQAKFADPEAYFAFDDYLNYADKEIKKCHDICSKVNKARGLNYEYPWRRIYRGRITGKDFETKKLNFQIDKERILKLLMGHTLYNDSKVVIRELAQNGIDACRLYGYGLKQSAKYEPIVKISWNSHNRTLMVQDNGTGMSRDTIFNHLLMVGSSRYQDENFKKEHPNFHSISRFGIGLLTCFMISDNIEIYTKEKDKKTKNLAIRNLNGNFIMRDVDDISKILGGNHGSTFILQVRDTTDLNEFEDIIRKWIILPEVKIQISVDGRDSDVGFNSGEEAIYAYTSQKGITKASTDYKVQTIETNGISVSCLLRRDSETKIWQFATFGDIGSLKKSPVGISIEGIRVTSQTPGYDHYQLISVVNCHGDDSPHTNVSRTAIENDSHYEKLLEVIYNSYLQIIREQINDIEDKFSPTWASEEAMYLVNRLHNEDYGRARLENNDIFIKCVESFPLYIVENKSKRELKSIDEMPKHLKTIENRAFKSACDILTEISDHSKTALNILSDINPNYKLDSGDILDYNTKSPFIDYLFFKNFQIVKLSANPETRTLILDWERKDENKWYIIDLPTRSFQLKYRRLLVPIKKESLDFDNALPYLAIDSDYGCILLPNNSLWNWIISEYKEDDKDNRTFDAISIYIASVLSSNRFRGEDGLKSFFNSEIELRDISKKLNIEACKQYLPTDYTVYRINDFYKHFELLEDMN